MDIRVNMWYQRISDLRVIKDLRFVEVVERDLENFCIIIGSARKRLRDRRNNFIFVEGLFRICIPAEVLLDISRGIRGSYAS